jgi:CRISPR-associated protein Csd1
MLHALLEYAQRAGLHPEPGFAPQTIRWAICADDDGNYLGVVPLGSERKGLPFPSLPTQAQSALVAKDGIRAQPLWDSAGFVLQWCKEEQKKASCLDRHNNFVSLLRSASEVMPKCRAAVTLLSDPDILSRARADFEKQGPPAARPEDKMTVRIGDRLLPEMAAVPDWWRGQYRALQNARKQSGRSKGGSGSMLDLLTGDLVVPAATHDTKITGLAGVGGRPQGDALVSFDKPAFTSFRLEQSCNAAMAEESAKCYSEALKHLIQNNGKVLAGAMVVPWFKEQVAAEDDPFAWILEAPEHTTRIAEARAAELLEAIRTGKRPDLAGNQYYGLTLSGAAGRVMVRDWIEGEYEELAVAVAAWFDDLAIVRADGNALASSPKFMAVIGALARELKDAPSSLVAQLWRAAAHRQAVPRTAMARALDRVRLALLADEPPRAAGLGLIKAYQIRSNPRGASAMQPHLNEDHPDIAYHAGRLLAVLARLQHAALGDVGAGVVQRYYIAASQTPALVLGRLVGNAKNHLNKLEGGLPFWFEDRISEIVSRFGDRLPRTLDLEGQSLFALGYYQQLAHDRAGRPASKEKPTNA